MGKMGKLTLFAVGIWIGCSTVHAGDTKAVKIIRDNMIAANAQEMLLKENIDKIKESRLFEVGAVTARQALRLKDLLERENLDNFKYENRTYRRAKNVLSSIAGSLSYLMEGIRKNPGNTAIFYKTTIALTLTSIETFNRMVKIAMKSKVKTVDALEDLTATAGTRSGGQNNDDDGYNLLTSAERVELMEECIGELRTLNRAILKMAYKLNTEVAWTYFFHEATPYHYKKINSIKRAKENAIEDINRLNWF